MACFEVECLKRSAVFEVVERGGICVRLCVQ